MRALIITSGAAAFARRGRAYWTAYAVTFMSDERVKVASTGLVRIDEYQELALSTPGAAHIREQPYDGGEKVAKWYVCRPTDPRTR